MARIINLGAELNSLTVGEQNSIAGTVSTSSGQAHAGTYAYRFNPSASGHRINFVFAAAGLKTVYVRFYLYLVSYPTNNTEIFRIADAGNANPPFTISSTGTGIKLKDGQGTPAQVGSNIALNLNQWYRIEVKCFSNSSTGTLDLLLDGVSQISASSLNTNGADCVTWRPGNSVNDTFDFYIDDSAINDGTGSFQNSYPGDGYGVFLRPDAAGDNNDFTVQVGGTVGSTNNFTRVNEVTPDDATSYNADAVVNHIDDFNIDATPSSIGSSDTVNVVQVGVRLTAVLATSEALFVLRVKASSGGTVEEGPVVTPNTTSWFTHQVNDPRIPSLTLYDLPGASTTAWTKADLDTAQIGYRISTGNTNAARISTIWLSVDSTPAAGTTTSTSSSTSTSTTTTSTSTSTSTTTTSTSSSTTTTRSTSTTTTSTSSSSSTSTTTTSTSSSTSTSTSTTVSITTSTSTTTTSTSSSTSTTTTSTSTTTTRSTSTTTTSTSTSTTTTRSTSTTTTSTSTSTTTSTSTSTTTTSTSSSTTTTRSTSTSTTQTITTSTSTTTTSTSTSTTTTSTSSSTSTTTTMPFPFLVDQIGDNTLLSFKIEHD